MASSDQVNSLLKQLTSAARFKAEVEDEAVLAHARRVTGAPELMVQLWDWPYWRSQYRWVLRSPEWGHPTPAALP